jgi:hypothetical protein
MDRVEVMALVNAERTRQDELFPDRTQYATLAPHVLVIEEKVAKLRAAWYRDGDTKTELVHLAAIAVRALEETKDYL